MTRKTRMWESFYGRFGDLNDPAALERCLQAMFDDPGVARLLPHSTRIRQEFATRDRTYPELFGVFHDLYAQRLDKARWGEQAAHLEVFAEPIFATWPEARMIHMVRHPVDWVASGSQRLPGGVGRELARWSGSARLALYNSSRFGDRYLIIQFEALLSEPIPTLQDVTAFIGEETNFGMGQTLLAALPTEAPSSRLLPAARRFVEGASASLLGSLGYPPPEPGESTGGVMTRLLAYLWFGAGRTYPSRI